MAAVVFAAAIIYSSSKFRDTLCGAIDINIKDSNQISFISRNDVLQLIHNPSHEILGTPLNDIDINDMEIYLQQQPYIRQADIYKTVNGHLKVDIQQRKPIVEIITATNKNYYIDEDGTIFPGSQKGKAPNVMVANGFISDKYNFDKHHTYNIYNENIKTSKEAEIFRLARYIAKDEFWRDQVEQIYVNESNEYEIVPLVGPKLLEIGSIDNYDEKLFYLKNFFTNGLKKTGWNKYQSVSVKYKGQIVCSKAI
ncbi:MAG: hypothetical protein IKR94_09660 [Bacteroidales bacterium]|nr:hypothetical protein [Bacteroidales bacterium]MBR4215572.1 hypothetical protein [Bacteroidales bacterium]